MTADQAAARAGSRTAAVAASHAAKGARTAVMIAELVLMGLAKKKDNMDGRGMGGLVVVGLEKDIADERPGVCVCE